MPLSTIGARTFFVKKEKSERKSSRLCQLVTIGTNVVQNRRNWLKMLALTVAWESAAFPPIDCYCLAVGVFVARPFWHRGWFLRDFSSASSFLKHAWRGPRFFEHLALVRSY